MTISIHPDLIIAQQLVYQSMGYGFDSFVQEPESKEYGACRVKMNNLTFIFRVAKITPTKLGQFVTLWKRSVNGPIIPYDTSDDVDLFIISVRKGEHLGQFIFPKDLLREKGFVSCNGKGGKRAMRVYPPWDNPHNTQAKKTQAWQLAYFVELQPMFTREKLNKIIFPLMPLL